MKASSIACSVAVLAGMAMYAHASDLATDDPIGDALAPLWPPLQMWLQLTGYLAVVAAVLVAVRAILTPLQEQVRRKKIEWIRQPEAGRPTVIVIHGTWGRKSRWFAGPEIYREILEKFADNVGVARFYWSGFNSMTARFGAATALASEIQLIQDRTNYGPILLLAHSHGGNVATLACKKLAYRSGTGLVAVSTPFLYYRYREIGENTTLMLGLAAVVAAIVGVFLGLHQVVVELHRSVTVPLHPFLEHAPLVAASGTLTSAILFAMLAYMCRAIFDREASRILQTGLAGPERTAVIRAPFDEASGVLSAARALISLLRMTVRACSMLSAKCTQVLPKGVVKGAAVVFVVSFLGLCVFGFLNRGQVGQTQDFVGEGLLFVSLIGLAVSGPAVAVPSLLLFAVVLLGLPCFLIAAIVVSLAYGVEVFSMSLRLDVGVEASPHGEAKIIQIESVDFARFTLDHSAILSDRKSREEVLSVLADLSKKLSLRGTTAVRQSTLTPTATAVAAVVEGQPGD